MVYGIIYLIIIIGAFCIIGEEPKIDVTDKIIKVQVVKGEHNVTNR